MTSDEQALRELLQQAAPHFGQLHAPGVVSPTSRPRRTRLISRQAATGPHTG